MRRCGPPVNRKLKHNGASFPSSFAAQISSRYLSPGRVSPVIFEVKNLNRIVKSSQNPTFKLNSWGIEPNVLTKVILAHKKSHWFEMRCPDSWFLAANGAWWQASRPMGGGGVTDWAINPFLATSPKNLSPRLVPDRKSTPGLKPGLVRTVHQEHQEQSAVQLWRHMVPTDTFTLCRVLSPTAPNPFQFDQYQSLKWLSEEIKTYENQQQHCSQDCVLMQVSGKGTKWISLIFIIPGAVQWVKKTQGKEGSHNV